MSLRKGSRNRIGGDPLPPLPLKKNDAIGEILLRIPPGESAYLVRASRVCKLWRRILSDPDFTRRYREFHPTPPLLGFFHNHYPDGDRRFIPTMAACPFTQSAVDCSRDTRNLVVWDPITGGREELLGPRAAPTSLHNSMMVLCAAASCDHGNCHGGPFLLVFVCNQGNSVHGCVYSSKAGAWGTPVSVNIVNGGYYVSANSAGHAKRGALVRDNAYFALRKIAFRGHEEFTTHNANPNKILKYDLGKNFLSVIDVEPALDTCIRDAFVMPMEDGSLGFAGIRDSGLYIWRRTVRRWGDARWVPCSTTTDRTICPDSKGPFVSVLESGFGPFVSGVGVAFVRINNSSIFMIEPVFSSKIQNSKFFFGTRMET
ncbi:hypothetical protein PVAP13_2NG019400 [Panicum virgatum]|uniref:F-box domain-containing protein n=1 Tax=Panicum virgatum TaxID=38727 RepID=A0A8T0VF05_PANVG|nr:hypothetical protein PVAP13_2NG019400 [Panicum virgatum]